MVQIGAAEPVKRARSEDSGLDSLVLGNKRARHSTPERADHNKAATGRLPSKRAIPADIEDSEDQEKQSPSSSKRARLAESEEQARQIHEDAHMVVQARSEGSADSEQKPSSFSSGEMAKPNISEGKSRDSHAVLAADIKTATSAASLSPSKGDELPGLEFSALSNSKAEPCAQDQHRYKRQKLEHDSSATDGQESEQIQHNVQTVDQRTRDEEESEKEQEKINLNEDDSREHEEEAEDDQNHEKAEEEEYGEEYEGAEEEEYEEEYEGAEGEEYEEEYEGAEEEEYEEAGEDEYEEDGEEEEGGSVEQAISRADESVLTSSVEEYAAFESDADSEEAWEEEELSEEDLPFSPRAKITTLNFRPKVRLTLGGWFLEREVSIEWWERNVGLLTKN